MKHLILIQIKLILINVLVYSGYKKVKGTLLLEKDINIECYTEELCAKYVKTFNHLVELYKMMKE